MTTRVTVEPGQHRVLVEVWGGKIGEDCQTCIASQIIPPSDNAFTFNIYGSQKFTVEEVADDVTETKLGTTYKVGQVTEPKDEIANVTDVAQPAPGMMIPDEPPMPAEDDPAGKPDTGEDGFEAMDKSDSNGVEAKD